MSRRAVLLGLAGAVVVAAALVLSLTHDGTPAAASSTAAEPSSPSPSAMPPDSAGSDGARAESALDLPVAVADSEAREQVETLPEIALVGRVVDGKTGEPVTSFHVLLNLEEPPAGAREGVVDAPVRDAAGRFRFPLAAPGVYRLCVQSSRHRPQTIDDMEVGAGTEELFVELDPGLAVSGRVVDDRTGAPVPDAFVFTDEAPQAGLRQITRGAPERCIHAVTAADGRFLLAGLTAEGQKIAAVHPQYAEGWQPAVPGRDEQVEIRLRRGPCVFGVAHDDAGEARAGLEIWLYGDELPVTRLALTDAAGRYRSPPLRPGRVELRACAPADAASCGCSDEWARADLGQADIRIDFGVRSDLATWRGTFRDAAGTPLPGASITLGLRPDDWSAYEDLRADTRTMSCDDQGRFEIRKLPPARYALYPRLADGSRPPELVEPIVHVEFPGILEKDIQVAPELPQSQSGQIRGIVIDGATGAPARPEDRPRVWASVYAPTFRMYDARLDEHGRFVFKGLPPAAYSVHAGGDRRNSPSVTVQVDAGTVVEDLRLTLRPTGSVRLCLRGFPADHPRTFHFSFESDGGERSRGDDGELAENGTFEATWPLNEGLWRVLVAFAAGGAVERTVQVRPLATTDVLIRPDEVVTRQRAVAVAGRLRWADGSPAAGAGIFFYGYEVPGLEQSAKSKSVRADGEGRFRAEGFLPGHWWVRVNLAEGVNPTFPDLVVTPATADPCPLDLVMPAGTVSGELCDASSGRPFDTEGPLWWVFLRDVAAGRNVCEIQGGHTGSHFELKAVPAGEFRLTVHARGYAPYVSESFRHLGNFDVDLGRILLEPCGVLVFELVDPDGHPVTDFRVFVDGQALFKHDCEPLNNGCHRISNLPAGSVRIGVQADGYAACQETLTLTAGEPLTRRFVLEKK